MSSESGVSFFQAVASPCLIPQKGHKFKIEFPFPHHSTLFLRVSLEVLFCYLSLLVGVVLTNSWELISHQLSAFSSWTGRSDLTICIWRGYQDGPPGSIVPSHACPFPPPPRQGTSEETWKTRGSNSAPLQTSASQPSSIIESPCQNQYNWIRPNTQMFSLKVRSVPFSLIYSLGWSCWKKRKSINVTSHYQTAEWSQCWNCLRVLQMQKQLLHSYFQ